MKKLSTLTAAAILLTVGCSQQPSDPAATQGSATPAAVATTPEAVVPQFSEATIQKAEELLKLREKGKFPYKQLSVKENGPAFVYLAFSSDDPQVITGALQGMDKTHSADKAYEKTHMADEKLDQTVLKALNSSDKSVLHYGLLASRDALGKEPNQEVRAKLLEIGTNHPDLGARVEAIEALVAVDGYEKDPEIFQLFVKALGDQAPVASSALFRRSYGFVRNEKAEEMKAVVDGLLKHEDPGVRGRAVEAFHDFHRDEKDLIIETLGPMTKDKNSYVRACAASALSKTEDPRAIALLMSLVDDTEKNTYDIKYTDLLGHQSRVHHDGSAWSRVNDAALYALDRATGFLPKEEQFVYDKINYKTVDEDIAAQAKKAKAWYTKFQASQKS